MATGFPISRDPPEGGTASTTCFDNLVAALSVEGNLFPISRDPPEGGTPMPERGW